MIIELGLMVFVVMAMMWLCDGVADLIVSPGIGDERIWVSWSGWSTQEITSQSEGQKQQAGGQGILSPKLEKLPSTLKMNYYPKGNTPK